LSIVRHDIRTFDGRLSFARSQNFFRLVVFDFA
jgi:hypothetical protein